MYDINDSVIAVSNQATLKGWIDTFTGLGIVTLV